MPADSTISDTVSKWLWKSKPQPTESEEQPSEQPEVQQATRVPYKRVTPQVNTTFTTVIAGVTPSDVDPEMVTLIRQKVMRKPTAYTTLIQKADLLVEELPDPYKRIRVAFKAMGDSRTVDQVVASFDMHLRDIQSEQTAFRQTSEAKRQQEVAALRQQAAVLMSQNNDIDTELASLDARANELRSKHAANAQEATTINSKADVRDSELQSVVLKFDAAAAYVANELQEQRNMIKTSLGN